MDRKIEIENYLKILYDFYKKSSFKFFVEKCLSFNIKIGDYNKNIDNLSKKVFNSVLNSLSRIENKVEYKETRFFYYLNVKSVDNNKFKSNIILDIPVFEDNYEKIALNILNYLILNEFNFKMKFYKTMKNSFFKVILEDASQCKRFVEYFNMNSEINSETRSRVIPFLYSYSLLGIYTEIEPYSFKNFYIKHLYEYFFDHEKQNDSDDVSLDLFLKYISYRYKIEKDLNKKRMFAILSKYIEICISDNSIYDLFDTNTVMSIGSYNSNDYVLKMDNYKMIYFIGKDDGTEIKYGTIDFLNIAYSKYFDNVIKKEHNDKYYSDFYNIYSDIIASKYRNIDNILLLLNNKMDIINKLLIVFSSAYFAYKKFDLPIKSVYMMLDIIIPKVYSYNEFGSSIVSNEYRLTDDYANKLVNLLDGTKLSMRDYLNRYDILSSIKNDSIIQMKSGETINGKEFIDSLYKYISLYNNFSELFIDLVSMIEYK